MESAYILAGTLFGGVGLKVIEYWLNRGKEKVDLAAEIRDELREDLVRYKAEAESYKKESDTWRQKYYDLLDKKNNIT